MDNLAILTAILVGLITIILLAFFLFRKKVKKDGVLIMGLSDSGKTVIFARLAYDRYVETYTSLKENVSSYDAGKNSVQLIDVPGQERVRDRVFDKFKSTARGVVFVVDSSKVQQELSDVAAYLHNVLCDEVIHSLQPDLLVLCNKQDEPLGKTAASIRAMLEKELNVVRVTRAARLAADDSAPGITLGDASKSFAFDDLPQNVTFAECSAILADEDSGPDLSQLQDWIQAL